ncbi:MAG: MaoC family dehydratase N-terminal domain-containing protein [Dehalococcoidia bacterium]
MADESLITDEMRAAIGKESEPVTHEVDRTAIRMFARSVGHTDPLYYDVAVARAAGYADIPAPPGYLGTPVFNLKTSDPTTGRRIGAGELQASRPLTRRLNGGTEIEYLGDICAGDVLTARTHLADVQERKGSIGQMLISTSKTTFRNQRDEVVAIMTGTGIRY